MPVTISIKETFARNRAGEELTQIAEEGILISDYTTARISIGQLKEALGFRYMDDVMEWLNKKGIATMRNFTDPNLEKIETENFKSSKQKFSPNENCNLRYLHTHQVE